jgi:hypothetical protein
MCDPLTPPAGISVPYCDNDPLAYEAWELILQVMVYAEDDASNRSHAAALTRLEATRGCKNLVACGTRAYWAISILALAKRAT